jgi:tRNA threonylcarbamoyladenosine biosynthesis protein TsaB
MSGRRILAIDTCLEACSVAICDDGIALAAHSEIMSRGHQERLAPMAAEAMTEVGAGFDTLDMVAVTVGPGSFTGLRVGLAFAKGLGLALGVPCIGVGVLEALAASESETGFVAATVDARRGQIYLQVFIDGRAAMAPDALPPELAAARLAELWPGGAGALVGSGAGLLAGVIPEARLSARLAADPVAIARIAARMRAPYPPPRPLYLRAPDARLPSR